MITREILEAQLDLYKNGQTQAVIAFEKAKADVNAFNGAIEACQNLLRILGQLEEAKAKSLESSDQKPAPEAKKKA